MQLQQQENTETAAAPPGTRPYTKVTSLAADAEHQQARKSPSSRRSFRQMYRFWQLRYPVRVFLITVAMTLLVLTMISWISSTQYRQVFPALLPVAFSPAIGNLIRLARFVRTPEELTPEENRRLQQGITEVANSAFSFACASPLSLTVWLVVLLYRLPFPRAAGIACNLCFSVFFVLAFGLAALSRRHPKTKITIGILLSTLVPIIILVLAKVVRG